MILKINKDKCLDCGMCEIILPGFKIKYDGYLFISETTYDNENTRQSILYVQDKCVQNAIDLIL